jgi:Lon protease-like protein
MSSLARLPLFPLHTVLYPGGRLPLRIFEQRYIEMAKACLRDGSPFGVCRILRGDEVLPKGGAAPEFAKVGTLARIASWDMPQQGILHVSAAGETRFAVRAYTLERNGLVVADAAALDAEPRVAVDPRFQRLVQLLELLAARASPQQFPHQVPSERAYDDASWVGYRLCELLPLPPPMKQSLLESNDAEARLAALLEFLTQERVL